METKSSKSLWTSAIATMASRACNKVLAGRGHADTADTVSRRTNILVRRAEKWTWGRNISLSSKAKPRKFSENIEFCSGDLLGRILGCRPCVSQQPKKYR